MCDPKKAFLNQELKRNLLNSCSRLNGNTSVCLNPLQKGGNPKFTLILKRANLNVSPCEGSVHANLTAQGGAKAGDSNLPVFAILIKVLQGTA